MKKPGIHLGGAVQLLFGIKGKRWNNNVRFVESSWYNKNEFWTSPLSEDIPKNYKLVEDGCYW